MTNKINGQFVPMTRELLESKAWRAANVHVYVRRLFDFLIVEHLRHGGKENGNLLAPWRQLADYDTGARIPARFVSDAIDKAVALGIVDVRRGDHRRPSTFALTMLPLHDGTPPSNRFLECDAAANVIIDAAKQAKRRPTSWNRNTARAARERSRDNGKVNAAPANGKVKAACRDKVNAGPTGQSECISPVMQGQSECITPQNPTGQSECTIEKALPGEEQYKKGPVRLDSKGVGEAVTAEADAPAVCSSLAPAEPEPVEAIVLDANRKCPAYVTNDFGFKICGKPVLMDDGRCPEHARPPPPGNPIPGAANGRVAA